jgi:hypothetical protein
VPKWPDGLDPPATKRLLDAAVPSASKIEGILTLPDDLHMLLLAAHSWAHVPLRRLLDLVDIAALVGAADRSELSRAADAVGLGRVWRTTIGVVDEILINRKPTVPGHTWARHLGGVRERTVAESHLQRCFDPFWARSVPRALLEVGRAARNAFVRRSVHDGQLGPAAHRRRRR